MKQGKQNDCESRECGPVLTYDSISDKAIDLRERYQGDLVLVVSTAAMWEIGFWPMSQTNRELSEKYPTVAFIITKDGNSLEVFEDNCVVADGTFVIMPRWCYRPERRIFQRRQNPPCGCPACKTKDRRQKDRREAR